ncbi:MAG: porin [Marinilabiliaceae bacterium]
MKDHPKTKFSRIFGGRRYHLILSFIVLLSLSNPVTAQGDSNPGDDKDYPSWKPAGFLQQHIAVDDMDENASEFSIHRARFGFAGSLSEKIKVNLIAGAIEPPDRSPALVNAFADFNFHPAFKLRSGQFRVPFGLEGPESITKNPAIERSFATRQMNPYRMFRNIGVMASGKISFLDYSFALLNGNGANQPENTNNKDLILRLTTSPISGLKAGFSGHLGSYNSENAEDLDRNRLAVHGHYKNTSTFLRGEWTTMEEETPAGNMNTSNGGYFLAGYHLQDNWNIISRFGFYNPDEEDLEYRGLTLGSNYFATDRTNLSVNGEAFTQTGDFSDANYRLTFQLQFVL